MPPRIPHASGRQSNSAQSDRGQPATQERRTYSLSTSCMMRVSSGSVSRPFWLWSNFCSLQGHRASESERERRMRTGTAEGNERASKGRTRALTHSHGHQSKRQIAEMLRSRKEQTHLENDFEVLLAALGDLQARKQRLSATVRHTRKSQKRVSKHGAWCPRRSEQRAAHPSRTGRGRTAQQQQSELQLRQCPRHARTHCTDSRRAHTRTTNAQAAIPGTRKCRSRRCRPCQCRSEGPTSTTIGKPTAFSTSQEVAMKGQPGAPIWTFPRPAACKRLRTTDETPQNTQQREGCKPSQQTAEEHNER